MLGKLRAALVAITLLAPASVYAGQTVPESSDPIKVVLNDWTGQFTSAKIAGELLKSMGYNVEYVSAGAVPQFVGLADGNLDFQPEVWDNLIGEIYPKAVASGEIKVVGELGLKGWQDFMYPAYLENSCPILPSYKALWDCAQLFATPDTFPKGRLIAYPADWGTFDEDLIKEIGAPIVAVPGGSEGAMMAEFQAAYGANKPIIMRWWSPHWIFAQHPDLKWIEWGKPGKSCADDAEFRKQTKDDPCGFVQPRVLKVVWGGFEKKWPAAYKLLNAMTLTNDDQNAMILEIDQKGRALDEVVAEWITNHKATWQPWVDQATK